MKHRKISTIEIEGELSLEPIVPSLWILIHSTWRKKYGIKLPDFKKLKDFGNVEDLRILTPEHYTITIHFEDAGWIQFKFLRGFITDLASVPKIARWLVDNDDSRITLASLCHDFLFSTHRLSFDDTNELFFQMCVFCGYPLSKSRIAWAAVSSIFGRIRWKANARKRCEWSEYRAEFLSPR
jgi:hypothetical protein